MNTNGFHVVIEGQYGYAPGAIYLYDDANELVMWESGEWIEDPALVYVIANAISLGYKEGPDAITNLLAEGQKK